MHMHLVLELKNEIRVNIQYGWVRLDRLFQLKAKVLYKR